MELVESGETADDAPHAHMPALVTGRWWGMAGMAGDGRGWLGDGWHSAGHFLGDYSTLLLYYFYYYHSSHSGPTNGGGWRTRTPHPPFPLVLGAACD